MNRVEAYHFWSTTCPPCNAIKPLMTNLKEEFDTVLWNSVNVQQDPNNYREKFGVTSWPTVVVVAYDVDGKVVRTERHSGTTAPGYYRILSNALKSISQ